MTDYERLTRYMQVGNKVVQVIPQRKERIQAYIDRLFDLEDKIESGELISKKEVERLQAENAALRERLEKAVELPFIVIDKMTGKEADEYEIALHEKWANDLVYCDMEGFAIEQDGTLILLDECGQFVYCSSDRFEVVPKSRLAELKGEEK